LPLLVGDWPVFMSGEISNRRVQIEIVVAENDREIRNTVENECVTSRSGGWNTGRQIGTGKSGEAPFAALPSGRILVLTSHFNPCSMPDGIFDPSLPHGETSGDRIAVPHEQALLYDSIDDPKTVTAYFLPELFRAAAGGVQIKAMKLSVTANNNSGLPKTLADSFPWMRNKPTLESQDYSQLHHRTNFQGFTLSAWQMEAPCEGIAADVAEPVLNQDAQFTPCRGRGKRLGWLIGQPNADLSELRFTTDEATTAIASVKYRETTLRDIAPGKWRPATELSPRRYAWTPRICIDDFCFRPEPQQHLVWTKYEVYFPKSKRAVKIDPE
jgi:hypothetical protein